MTYQGRIQAREPLAVLPPQKAPAPEQRRSRKAEWRDMTSVEQSLAKALADCTFPPATNQKRFARNIAAQASSPNPQITNKQREYLHKMVHRYRRQIPVEILELRMDDAEEAA